MAGPAAALRQLPPCPPDPAPSKGAQGPELADLLRIADEIDRRALLDGHAGGASLRAWARRIRRACDGL